MLRPHHVSKRGLNGFGAIYCTSHTIQPLRWRHNERDGVSNHQPHDWPVTGKFPAQRSSNEENVSIWWRHHAMVEVCIAGWMIFFKFSVAVIGFSTPNLFVHAWFQQLVNGLLNQCRDIFCLAISILHTEGLFGRRHPGCFKIALVCS